MFEIPSNPLIEKCIVTKETVINKEAPKIIIDSSREKETKTKVMQRKSTTKKDNTFTA